MSATVFLSKLMSNSSAKNSIDSKIKVFLSNWVYLYDLCNPYKSKLKLFSEFSYDKSFLSIEDSNQSSRQSSQRLNLVVTLADELQENMDAKKMSHSIENIYHYTKGLFQELPSDHVQTVSLDYIFSCLQHIFDYDLDAAKKANKKNRVLENGLTAQEYADFDALNKALAAKILKIVILRFRTYLVP